MGEAGALGGLVLRADMVADIYADGRDLVVLMQDNVQAVIKVILGKADTRDLFCLRHKLAVKIA